MTTPYAFHPGTTPLLVSMPHTGLGLTPAVATGLSAEAADLGDTDWHMEALYDFLGGLGANVLVAQYSRFVIDLNRPPDDTPLYTTATTGLFPDITFDGIPAFKPGAIPSETEHDRYLAEVWTPYHAKIEESLQALKAKFGYALLFDAHSIRSVVPRLFDGRLPDLNFGTNEGKSCAPSLRARIAELAEGFTDVTHVVDGRFKGGYITRHYGRPDDGIHAVQLEMTWDCYMDETPPFAYRPDKAAQVQPLLRELLRTMRDWTPQ
jgi:N-formylglutamate deformylase